MPRTGFEPARVASLPPQSSASASSATWARMHRGELYARGGWCRVLARRRVEVECCVVFNQAEGVADLLVADLQEEVAVRAVALGAEDVEIRLGIFQGVGAERRAGAQTIRGRFAEQRRGQLHRARGRVALVNLELLVERRVG